MVWKGRFGCCCLSPSHPAPLHTIPPTAPYPKATGVGRRGGGPPCCPRLQAPRHGASRRQGRAQLQASWPALFPCPAPWTRPRTPLDAPVSIWPSPSPPAQLPLTRTPRLHLVSACRFIAFPPQDMYLNFLLVNITTGDANMCRGSINNPTQIDTHTDSKHRHGSPRETKKCRARPEAATSPNGFVLIHPATRISPALALQQLVGGWGGGV